MDNKQADSDRAARVDSNKHARTRRRLVTGGVAAGVTLPWLPQQWSKPAVESVMLPAHAETSPGEEPENFTGVFQATTITVASASGEPSGQRLATRYLKRALDWVVRPARAHHVLHDICNENDLTLTFDIPEGPDPRTCRICAAISDSGSTNYAETAVNGNTLDDVTIQLNEGTSCNSVDEALTLSGMTVNEGGVSGNGATDDTNGTTNECNFSFIAPSTGGSFECSDPCL